MANSNLYSEYIGAMWNGVRFSDVPINRNTQFHFILAFAIDYTDSPTPVPANGTFRVCWQDNVLTPLAVADIKARNPNVKVALSLGVHSIGPARTRVIFTAPSVDQWVSRAVTSLTQIIRQYNLDGIDIDYENFGNGSIGTFVECIGRLLTTLKRNGVVSFASIAPGNDQEGQARYQELWRRYSSVIDYINFQFYGFPKNTTVEQFLNLYNRELQNYPGSRMLAGFATAADEGGLRPENGFFRACRTLRAQNKLPGIFNWCADDTRSNRNNFQYEVEAQEVVTNN